MVECIRIVIIVCALRARLSIEAKNLVIDVAAKLLNFISLTLFYIGK